MACGINNSVSSDDIFIEELEDVCSKLFKELAEDAILGLCFEVHRSVKLGYFFMDEGNYSKDKYKIVHDENLYDIFGHTPLREQMGFNCPKCGTYSTASRFVIHLMKCINKRQCAIKVPEKSKYDSESDEYDAGSDDSRRGRRRSNKKQTKRKNSKKGRKKANEKNGVGVSNGNVPLPIYSEMTTEEHRAHLSRACGVISEWTKKMCTKSIKCSKHTEQQRRLVRYYLLESVTSVNLSQLRKEVPVDVDSVT